MQDVRRVWILACLAALAPAAAPVEPQPARTPALLDRVRALTRESKWTQVAAIPVAFATHHPQGMVKIGDAFFISSVEIRTRTKRYAEPVDGYDRDTGEGTGHLFKMDSSGNLIADVSLGEGTVYHPGGIDFDGKDIWVPVAEYRPDSRSIMYRVDPATMKATEAFRFADHIGAVACNSDDRTLHGVSWGSRRFYRWTLGARGDLTNAGAAPGKRRTLNPSHYVDYQDCKYAGARRMLCTGVAEIRQPSRVDPLRLGGIEVIDLDKGHPEHQVPVLLWTSGGLAMTQNPVWIEPRGTGLRAYFMPEDDKSTLYVYDAQGR